MVSRTPLLTPVVALLLLGASLTACDGAPGSYDGPIDRETFIATYVDLRLSALGTPDGVTTDDERGRVLSKHGVTAEEVEGFAEVWGSDPAAMKSIWEEVQLRLRIAAGEDTTTSVAVPSNLDAH